MCQFCPRNEMTDEHFLLHCSKYDTDGGQILCKNNIQISVLKENDTSSEQIQMRCLLGEKSSPETAKYISTRKEPFEKQNGDYSHQPLPVSVCFRLIAVIQLCCFVTTRNIRQHKSFKLELAVIALAERSLNFKLAMNISRDDRREKTDQQPKM